MRRDDPGMGSVASFGSVNVDHVRYCKRAFLEYAERYAWFPEAGETRTVEGIPDEFAAAFDRTFLGGKGANQAVAAAVAGADATFLGAVGDDAGEYAVRETLTDRGVDVAGVERVDGPTGAAYVAVDEDGENHIAVVPGANGRVDPAYARRHADTLRGADCVLLQNELPVAATLAALDVLAEADGRGDGDADRPVVVFDPAPADDAGRVLAHERVDVVTPNDGEYARLEDELDSFDGVVVRTRGGAGVRVDRGTRGRRRTDAFEIAPPAVDPIDTTGAGDVFDGYLAAALADDEPLRDAVRVATAAAALSTTNEGVQTAVPEPQRVADRID